MASRAFTIFAKASGLGWIHEATRKRSILALQAALRKGAFLSEQAASEDPWTWSLRPPSRQAVHVCELGSRTLHEVPAHEVPVHEVPATESAKVMLEIRAQNELISKEKRFRHAISLS